jgi:hypothetical protein
VRYCFIFWKACSASSVHANGPGPLISLKKGRALSASLKMKRLRATRDPVNLCTSLRRAGGLITSIARILSRFASIPRCDTRNPRSFPAETPKMNFSGLSFVEVARSLSKTRAKFSRREFDSLVLTMMSLTYTSTISLTKSPKVMLIARAKVGRALGSPYGVYEGQKVTPGGGVYNLIYSRKWIGVFWTCLY